MTAIASAGQLVPEAAVVRRRTTERKHVGSHVFLIIMTVLWTTPLLWAMYTSLRPYGETAKYGYLSLPHHLTFSNFTTAWTQADDRPLLLELGDHHLSGRGAHSRLCVLCRLCVVALLASGSTFRC